MQSMHRLESQAKDCTTAVSMRREIIRKYSPAIEDIPFLPENQNYERIHNVHCENVIGHVTVPMGLVGPLLVNNQEYYVPMATTEGALLASTMRGCKATRSSSIETIILDNSITRSPVFQVSALGDVPKIIHFLQTNQYTIKQVVEATSSHLQYQSIDHKVVGRLLYIRLSVHSGEAMGMNMVTKAADAFSTWLMNHSPCEIQLVSLSSNYCADKKVATVNFQNNRGKYVIAECILSAQTLQDVLHTTPQQIANIVNTKCILGSAIAGSAPTGCNAQAANIVAAIFLATGQDLGHVGTSSAAITTAYILPDQSLLFSVTMPNVEVGVIGGGTRLPCQAAAIQLIKGPNPPLLSSESFAQILAATVLCAELSLLAALCNENELLHAHMSLNRPKQP